MRGPRDERPDPDEEPIHRHTAEIPLLDPDDENEEDEATEPAVQPQAVATDDRPASLVIQTSFLGDMVLTTGLIAELARRGPVDVVATPASAPLLANNPDVRDVIRYDKRGDDGGLGGLWRTAQQLRRSTAGPRKVRAAYLAQGSSRSAVLAVIAGIRERIGFDTSSGSPLYTRRIAYRDDRHHAERLWRLSQPEGVADPSPEVVRPRLYPGLEEVSQVDGLLEAFPDDGTPLVALAPGSIWGTKRWPGYPALARLLAPHARLVAIGGIGDAPLAAEIVQEAGAERVLDAMGRLSLLASAELIARCRVLVTNDSAPQHLASAMDTPTVAIFGPTVPAFGFGPLATRRAVLGHDALPCRPCHRHGPESCPLGHWRCMTEIPAEAVAARVHELLG